jgi:cysteine desulfurase/selenocysteine lyase
MIEDVTMQGYIAKKNREGREPWTPNIVWAISLGAAVEYIEEKWLESLQAHDEQLVTYFLQKYKSRLSDKYLLVGKETSWKRIGIFSLIPKNTKTNLTLLGEKLWMKNIAVRTGWHCTHPYWHQNGDTWSLRISFGCYTEFGDIDSCIDALMDFAE